MVRNMVMAGYTKVNLGIVITNFILKYSTITYLPLVVP